MKFRKRVGLWRKQILFQSSAYSMRDTNFNLGNYNVRYYFVKFILSFNLAVQIFIRFAGWNHSSHHKVRGGGTELTPFERAR